MMKYLTTGQVVRLNERLIKKHGGSVGIRDRNLLESAINKIRLTFDNIELYPSIREKASALGYSIIKNHPFVDGNKHWLCHNTAIPNAQWI